MCSIGLSSTVSPSLTKGASLEHACFPVFLGLRFLRELKRKRLGRKGFLGQMTIVFTLNGPDEVILSCIGFEHSVVCLLHYIFCTSTVRGLYSYVYTNKSEVHMPLTIFSLIVNR